MRSGDLIMVVALIDPSELSRYIARCLAGIYNLQPGTCVRDLALTHYYKQPLLLLQWSW